MGQLTTAKKTVVAFFLHRHKQWHFQFPVHDVDQERPSTQRKENSWVCVCVCVCPFMHGWERRGNKKGRSFSSVHAHRFHFFSAEFCGMTYKLFFFLENMSKSSFFSIGGQWYKQPRCCTCSWATSVDNVMDKTTRWSYLCHLPPLQPHQYNELLVYHMCEMHQRNVTVCVCLSVCVCVWERPCVLTLPIVFTATRPAICSEAQTVLCVLLRAVVGIGFGCISSPFFRCPQSPVSVRCLLSNSGFCLVFSGGG